MIVYTFAFDDETSFRFEVDELGDSSVESPGQSTQDWLMLERGKCEGCAIPAGARKTCPAALSLQPLLASFGDLAPEFDFDRFFIDLGTIFVRFSIDFWSLFDRFLIDFGMTFCRLCP